MSTNTELIAEARLLTGDEQQIWWSGRKDRALRALADRLEAAEAELTRRDTVTDEAVEAAARAMALVDNDDGCFERLDLWNATAPEDRWQIEEPQSYDEEATHWWRKRARAALAAAPVSLEAVKADTPAEPAWSDAISNDGEYEYTSTGSCDGSESWFYRRRPALHRDAGPWETITADEHRAASVKWGGYGARDAAEGDNRG